MSQLATIIASALEINHCLSTFGTAHRQSGCSRGVVFFYGFDCLSRGERTSVDIHRPTLSLDISPRSRRMASIAVKVVQLSDAKQIFIFVLFEKSGKRDIVISTTFITEFQS